MAGAAALEGSPDLPVPSHFVQLFRVGRDKKKLVDCLHDCHFVRKLKTQRVWLCVMCKEPPTHLMVGCHSFEPGCKFVMSLWRCCDNVPNMRWKIDASPGTSLINAVLPARGWREAPSRHTPVSTMLIYCELEVLVFVLHRKWLFIRPVTC